MFYYQVIHKYKLIDHFETKEIGIYSTIEKANKTIDNLKVKEGFKYTIDGFKVTKMFKFIKPKLLDKTFWIDGFDTYI